MVLKQWVNRQAFAPNIFGLFINPFYFARKGLYRNIKELSHFINGNVIDVGCGQKPYRGLFDVSSYVGMDIEQSGHSHSEEEIDVYYDGKTFPFSDNNFDCAICNQVLEHVFNPEEFISEIYRVLRKDGKLLLTVPFVWDEHEQPYDYARYSSFGLKYLLEKNGFKVIDQRKSISDIRLIFQLVNAYIYKKTKWSRKFSLISLATKFFYCTIFNTLGTLLYPICGKNDDLYLDNVILANKC